MLEDEPIAGAPLVNIPGGTRWVKITNPHPGQVIKVRKTNDLSVFYTQEKPGQSQGRVNGQHRADRQSFLRDYEPYAKRDWIAAQRVLASMERNGEHHEEEQPTLTQTDLERLNEDTGFTTPVLEPTSDEQTEEQLDDDIAATKARIADMVAHPVPITVELNQSEQPTFELADVPEAEAEPVSDEEIATAALLSSPEPPKPIVRRTRPGEINATEQEEILELWRAEQSVDEIARTYNATTQTIYNVLDAQAHEEYALWRIVELVKRDGGGPIKAYKVSQWMHIPKDGVKELCTSEAAQKVLRYFLDQRDPKRPWIETPMLELVPESEPEMATKPTTNNVVETPVPPKEEVIEYDVLPVRKRRWEVSLLTIVKVHVEADNLIDAHTVAMTTYPDTTDIVGVTEER